MFSTECQETPYFALGIGNAPLPLVVTKTMEALDLWLRL